MTLLGCFIPNTKMKFGQGKPHTGCLTTYLFRIQNQDPENFQKEKKEALMQGGFFFTGAPLNFPITTGSEFL